MCLLVLSEHNDVSYNTSCATLHCDAVTLDAGPPPRAQRTTGPRTTQTQVHALPMHHAPLHALIACTPSFHNPCLAPQTAPGIPSGERGEFRRRRTLSSLATLANVSPVCSGRTISWVGHDIGTDNGNPSDISPQEMSLCSDDVACRCLQTAFAEGTPSRHTALRSALRQWHPLWCPESAQMQRASKQPWIPLRDTRHPSPRREGIAMQCVIRTLWTRTQ